MLPLVGSLMSGVSSIFGSMMNANEQDKTNAMQMQLAANNNAFQERMSNTAYQRASADMQAAGLNPMMMFGSGSSASTPSGNVAQLTAPKPGAGIIEAGDTVNKMISGAVQMKLMDKMTTEIANLQATKDKIVADTAASQAGTKLTAAQQHLTEQRTATETYDTDTASSRSQISRNAAKTASNILSDINPTFRKYMDIAGWTSDKASQILGPVGDVISSARGINSMIPKRSTTERYKSFLPDGEQTFEERWGH